MDAINADYERHSRAAEEIAREYFAHDVVLGRLLDDLGAELTSGRGYIVRRDAAGPFPAATSSCSPRSSRAARPGSRRPRWMRR